MAKAVKREPSFNSWSGDLGKAKPPPTKRWGDSDLRGGAAGATGRESCSERRLGEDTPVNAPSSMNTLSGKARVGSDPFNVLCGAIKTRTCPTVDVWNITCW